MSFVGYDPLVKVDCSLEDLQNAEVKYVFVYSFIFTVENTTV